jgi:KRAB domain-containing zinc finger protein
MATLDLMTGMASHPDYFCLDQELTRQTIPLIIGNTMMIDGMEVTLDPEFEDLTTKPCVPVQITDSALVKTILRNQSDSSVASACASYLEHMTDYMCAEAALKEQRLDVVNIEVTSWVEKKKLKSAVDISSDSDLDSSPQKSTPAVAKSVTQGPTVRQISPASSSNVVSLLHGTNNKRVYRCSRCSFTHSELKEVAAHQATFHLPEKKIAARPPPGSLALNISKVQCPHCQQKHIVGRYSCRNCSFETMCPMELEQHMWNIHKSMHIYHCPCCTFISQTYMHIENHLVQDHALGKKDTTAPATPAVEKPKEVEKPHEEVAEDIDSFGRVGDPEVSTYNCDTCRYHSNSEEDFKTHISKYHNMYSCMAYMCLLCGKEAFNKRGLELHSKNRHKAEPQSFALNSNSRKTMLDITDRKCIEYLKKGLKSDRMTSTQWWCLVCGSGPQPYVYHLTPHIASHLCYTPYECSICGMQFKLQLLANNHIKESKECAKSRGGVRINTYLKKLQMADIEILRKDVSLYNGYAERKLASKDSDLPFLCQICHYACRTASVLQLHMFLHLTIKPHRCPVSGCESAYAYKQGCIAHIKKAHGNDKSLVNCIVTVYDLFLEQKREAQSLVLENSVHLPSALMTSRCYSDLDMCTICNFGPCGRAGLAIHTAFHSTQTPYECGKCGQKFKQDLVASIHALEAHQSSGIRKDEAAAAAQQQWVATTLKVPGMVAPEYSLKPIPKHDPAAATVIPPATPSVAHSYRDIEGTTRMVLAGSDLSLTVHLSTPVSINHKKLYRCKQCHLYSTNYSNSKNHVVMHLPHKPYECAICGEKYQSTMFCGKHLHSHGPDISMKKHLNVLDDIHNEQSKAAADLIEELPVEEGTNVAELLASNQKLKGKKTSDDIVSESLSPGGSGGKSKSGTAHREYVCVYCRHDNASRRGARQHFLMKHAKITPYSCTFCSFESSFHQVVQDHVNKEHPELHGRTDVVFVTEVKERSLKKSLDRYLAQSYKPNRRGELLKGSTASVPEHYRAICITSSGRSCIYKCSKCSYTARSIDAFKKHVQDHLEIEQYRCAHCDYSNDKHIYRHIRNIHGSKEEYDDVVETKAYIMLVSQMEDLAREVLLLDEMFHTEDSGDIAPEAFPCTPEYTCICLHCKEKFISLVNARKHHREVHSSKQLMVDVDLCFAGAATDQNKLKEEEALEDLDDTPESVKEEAHPDSDDEPLSKKIKQEPKGLKVRSVDAGSVLASKSQTRPTGKLSISAAKMPSSTKSKVPVSNKSSVPVGKAVPVGKVKVVGALIETRSGSVGKNLVRGTASVQKKVLVESNPSEKVRCHLCHSNLFNMTSLKRHFIIGHTGLRPFQCSINKCKFTSHERYEVKRHSVKCHDGKAKVIKNEKDSRMALEAMKNFIDDWRASDTGLLLGSNPLGNPKLDMRPVVQLEDISKNPGFAKYF